MPRSKGLWKDELKEEWEKLCKTSIDPSKCPLSGRGAREILRVYTKGTEPLYRINDSSLFSVTGEIRGADGFSATLSVPWDYVRGRERENPREILRMRAEELYIDCKKEKLVPTGIRVSVENKEHETIGWVDWGLERNDLTQRLVPRCGLRLSPNYHYLSYLSKPYNEGLPRALEFLADIAKVASRYSPADEPWVY